MAKRAHCSEDPRGAAERHRLVADDLYLMAHDDVTGRSFLQPRALGLGLAGGLLAELMLAGSISLSDGWLVVSGLAPPDDLGCAVHAQVLGEVEARPARDWLMFLACTATSDVAWRLGRGGYLIEVAARRPWRATRWLPADSDCAFATLARARPALERPDTAKAHGTVLAGLAIACGLGSRLLPYGPPDARRQLAEAVRRLPPGIQELIAQTQATVDSALLAQRV